MAAISHKGAAPAIGHMPEVIRCVETPGPAFRSTRTGIQGVLGLSVLVTVYACFCGCAGAGRPGAPSPRQRAVAQQSRVYALGKVPDQERERAFQDLLASAQAEAVKKHGGASEIGFSYYLAPRGAVYPFSEAEVSCLLQKSDIPEGKRLCSDFFKAVDAGIGNILKP